MDNESTAANERLSAARRRALVAQVNYDRFNEAARATPATLTAGRETAAALSRDLTKARQDVTAAAAAVYSLHYKENKP